MHNRSCPPCSPGSLRQYGSRAVLLRPVHVTPKKLGMDAGDQDHLCETGELAVVMDLERHTLVSCHILPGTRIFEQEYKVGAR